MAKRILFFIFDDENTNPELQREKELEVVQGLLDDAVKKEDFEMAAIIHRHLEKLRSATAIDELMEGIRGAMEFQELDPAKISNMESNAGGVWFTFEGEQYFIFIDKCKEEEK